MRAVEFFESTGREIKKWFANQGVKVKVRNIRGKYIHVAPVDGNMPNEFRKMVIDKVPFFQDANIRDMDMHDDMGNIDYGNIRPHYIAISPEQWDMVMAPESGRQLRDPSREVMVVKDGKVIVIDAENEAEYLENGWELAESVNEATGKQIEVDSETVKAIGKEDGTYWWQGQSGLKNVYSGKDAKEKFRYSLRNVANQPNAEELVKQLDDEATEQGRPRGAAHIENIRFWDLPDDELRFIMKDASEAMDANPEAGKATTGPGNWADQVNDAHTVLGWRIRNPRREAKRKAKRPTFSWSGNISRFAEDKEPEGPYAIVWHGQYLEWYGDGNPAEGEGRYKPKGDAGNVLAKNIPTYAIAQKLLPATAKMSDVGDYGDYGEDGSLVTNSSSPEIVPMSELEKHFYGYNPDSQEHGAKPEQDDHHKVMDLKTKMIDISQPEVGYVESTASAWESYKNTSQKKRLTKYHT